jgi:TRAP-type C4-dicarboxylate transport system substrate-binding protein
MHPRIHIYAIAYISIFACSVRAEPQVLRMASVAPEGTNWARELKALGRDIELETHGEVKMKWYLGGIAGSDVEAGQRVARGQLDGIGAGVWQCERWSPSMRVTRLPGLFRDREESKLVGARLRTLFEDELKKSGFIYLGGTEIGPSILFLRKPVKSFAELQQVKLWSLADDVTKVQVLGALGLHIVPVSFEQSRAAFDGGEVDGFAAPPTGALAFQWSTQAHYLLNVVTDWLLGCVVVSARAFDKLPIEHQRVVRAATAKFLVRFDDVGAEADRKLLGGLFERNGMTRIEPDARFQADFAIASQAAWAKLGGMASPALLEQVRAILDAHRAEVAKH